MSNHFNGLLEFGKCRLDAEKKFLWYGGQAVQLPLKAIELLCVLVESGGAVVTKDEIWQRVWHDSFVEETNLTHNIYILRKTFKSLGEPDLIETVPRRGYRFTGEVRVNENEDRDIVIERHTLSQTLIEEVSSTENEKLIDENNRLVPGNIKTIGKQEKTRNSPLLLLNSKGFAFGAVLLLALASGSTAWLYHNSIAKSSLSEIKSVAVLPFQNFSENENEKTLSLGLADALISKLGGLNRFTVRPLSATQKYKVGETDALNLGELLKVDAVLEGSLQTVDNRLRVNVRLFRVPDGSQVWAGSFDETETDVFKLQDMLSAQVANSLIDRITPEERKLLALRPTENLEAYKLYLKGRYFWNQRTVEAYFKAIEFFGQSVRLDPNFAAGYSGIADCYALLEQRGGLPPEVAFPQAEYAARKALELDERLAEAHTSMALVKELYRWNWNESKSHYRRAIELNPNYATAYGGYGMLLITEKRFDEAEAQLKKAESLDPTSRSIAIYLAWNYYFSRQYDRAIEQCRKVLELDNSLTAPYIILRAAFEQKGMYSEAVESELNRLKAGDSQTLDSLKNAYQKSDIKGFWQKQIEVYRKTSNSGSEVPDYDIATRYALLNQSEEALREIEKGFVNRGSMWHMIDVDPAFDSLRTSPRFQDLLGKLDLMK